MISPNRLLTFLTSFGLAGMLWLAGLGKCASAQNAGEPGVFTITKPEHSAEEVRAAYAEMPPVIYTAPADRWQHLVATKAALEAGELRVVMLGDSIVNDTWRSRWLDLAQAAWPKCNIALTNVVRGGTGCWWYKDEGRVTKYVLPHKPQLLIIGGISQNNDPAAVREVIRQVRAAGPCDVLLMTGPFGGVNPRDEKTWTDMTGEAAVFRAALKSLASEEKCGFLDMWRAWGNYVRESGRDIEWFMRDPVHANARGEQILGHILAAFLSPTGEEKAPAIAPLKIKTPAGVEFTIGGDGLSAVKVGEREVATGGWFAWDAGPGWFGEGAGKTAMQAQGYSRELYAELAKRAVKARKLESIGPHSARVTHLLDHAIATTTFRCGDTIDARDASAEDITISTTIENHGTTPLAVPAVGGLRFGFSKTPRGEMPVWHTSYLTANKGACFHPSSVSRFGGAYAEDGTLGIGATPLTSDLAPTLLFWDFDDWNPGHREADPVRWFTYAQRTPIPPGGALTLRCRLRFSTKTEWQHLLEPYKKQFLALTGGLQYRPDHRVVAAAYINRDQKSISPENPYGLHGGAARLDTDAGLDAFASALIPGLQKARGQGIVIWGQSGDHPRGAMYRPDFDVMPPEIETRLARLAEKMKAAGLRTGVCTRPGEVAYADSWKTDTTMRISADAPDQLEMMGRRFDNLVKLGCSIFYLDSFGCELNDVRILRALRARLGPDAQTYVEHPCDLAMAWSGAYSETDFYAADQPGHDAPTWQSRTGERQMELYRWLLGDVPMITRSHEKHGRVPADFESVWTFCFRHRYTPLVDLNVLPELAEKLATAQAAIVGADGRWKP